MPEVDGLADLPLLDYAPRSCLRAPSHIVPKASFPAIDGHNHLGKWLSPGGEWTVPDVWSLQHAEVYTLIWVVIILGVFVPVSIRQYQRTASR